MSNEIQATDFETKLYKKVGSTNLHLLLDNIAQRVFLLDGRTVQEAIGQVENTASNATNLANAAQSKANSAYILADAANSTASNAAESAQSAQNTANEAKSLAVPMQGATTTAAGKAGLVPQPSAGNPDRFLSSDGSWKKPQDLDTTYDVATQSANGLMSASDKTKLDGIQAGAQVNPDLSGYATTSAMNAALAGKAGTSTASQSANGLMSADDKKKLDGIAAGATNTAAPPAAATVAPLAPGTAAVGTSTKYAREDHVHPSNDTDTHWTTHLYAGTSTGNTNAATANGQTHLMVLDNSTVRDRRLIKGTGGTTVTSDANGNIIINSPNISGLQTDFDDLQEIVDKAVSDGQIGGLVNKSDVDFNTLVDSGRYTVYCGTGMANYQPRATIGHTSTLIVDRYSTVVRQILITPTLNEIWVRASSDSGASWFAWNPVCGFSESLTLYISKSGSDNNTGLQSDYPVASFERAFGIANALMRKGSNSSFNICIGAGDWGSLVIDSKKYIIYLMPYDGAIPTAYSNNLPTFTSIWVYNTLCFLRGINGAAVYSAYNGYIIIQRGYKRLAQIVARTEGTINIESENSATNVIDIVQGARGDNQDVIYAYNSGKIIFDGYCHLRLAESNTCRYFLHVGRDSLLKILNNYVVRDPASYSFTGAKFFLESQSFVDTGDINAAYPSKDGPFPTILSQVPGTGGTVQNGAMINGSPVGFGWAANYVAKAGDTMSGNLSIANAAPVFIAQNNSFDISTPTSTNLSVRPFVLKDKNGVEMGGLECNYTTDGLLTFRIHARRTVGGTTRFPALTCGVTAAGLGYTTAIYPSGGYNSNNLDIATTKWVQEHLANVVSSAVQRTVGQVTVQSSTAGAYTDWTLTNLVVNKFCFVLANVTADTSSVDRSADIRVISGAYNGQSLGNTVLAYSIGYRSGLAGSSRYYVPGSNVFAFIPSATTTVLRVTGYNQTLDLRAYQ